MTYKTVVTEQNSSLQLDMLIKKLYKKWCVTHKCPSITPALQEGRELTQPLPPIIVYPQPTGNVLTDCAAQKQVKLNHSIKAE